MMTHPRPTHNPFPASFPHGLATRVPDARWPEALLELYRTAHRLHCAAQSLWQQAQAARWTDERLTRAYRKTFDALDEVEWLGAAALRAWEASHS